MPTLIAVASRTHECISYYIIMGFMSCHVSNKKVCHNKLHPDEMKQCLYFFLFAFILLCIFTTTLKTKDLCMIVIKKKNVFMVNLFLK